MSFVLQQMSKRIRKQLEKTKFFDSPIVAIAANPGGSDDNNQLNVEKSDGNDGKDPIGLKLLLDTICNQISIPERNPNEKLILSVDHCFAIRGSGTVMTGTIIQGSIAVNDVSLKLLSYLMIFTIF